MADGDLASVLAGGGPLGPLQLQAALGAGQAARPENYSGGPVGQAMGMWGATLAQGRALDAARQIAEAQQGALPALGKYLASPDPLAAAAADSAGDPVARWMMLGHTSAEQMAQMRQALSAAQLQQVQAETQGLTLEAYRNRMLQGGGGVPPVGGGGVTPVARGVFPGAPATMGSGRYPAPGQPGDLGAGAGGLPVAPETVPADKLQEYLDRLPKLQRAAAIARIRAHLNLTGAPAAAPASAGAGTTAAGATAGGG